MHCFLVLIFGFFFCILCRHTDGSQKSLSLIRMRDYTELRHGCSTRGAGKTSRSWPDGYGLTSHFSDGA